MATRVRSHSKINLGLAIGPVRPDGFHGLVTLYQTLALHDVVTVEARPTSQNRDSGQLERLQPMSQMRDLGNPVQVGASRITLTTNHPGVPTDARNTAWKMVELALQRMGMAAEVAIHIEKELPVQGGMGAGSANAAAALLGLERELGMALPEAERLEIAAAVGSDVPLFLIGGAVLGLGRGEIVSGMDDLPATPCVVAVPEVGVSTPRAFRDWDERQGSGIRANTEYGCLSTPLRSGRDDESNRRSGREDDPNGGLTSSPQGDRLEELSHVYASVLQPSGQTAWGQTTEVQPDTSGIVRGQYPEKKQGGSEVRSPDKRDGSFEQGNTRNDLAENALLALVRTGIENDFEQVVFPQYPLLREIKHELMGIGTGSPALYAALSGSGSALFGLYRSQADAEAAQRRVQASGCKALLTETLPRSQYWRTMFAE